MIALIFAESENGVIGRDGGLPWHLPADLKRFKALTTGHTLVMGRKTFESIGRPLPHRRSIVITRNPALRIDGVDVAHSLDEALALATGDVFVIGGAAVYRMALPRADRVYRTVVHAEIEGDVRLGWDRAGWRRVRHESQDADPRHVYPLTFEVWERSS